MSHNDGMPELKDCPFCEITMQDFPDGNFGHPIERKGGRVNSCILRGQLFDKSERDVWNTRAERKTLGKVTGETSDGYHTFNELYDHRCLLWINLCLEHKDECYLVENHFEGWFLLGMESLLGQMSYHCPNKFIHLVKQIPRKHPEYDGHKSMDVLDRLLIRASLSSKFAPPTEKNTPENFIIANGTDSPKVINKYKERLPLPDGINLDPDNTPEKKLVELDAKKFEEEGIRVARTLPLAEKRYQESEMCGLSWSELRYLLCETATKFAIPERRVPTKEKLSDVIFENYRGKTHGDCADSAADAVLALFAKKEEKND